jgi:hypothetical protein
VVLRRCIVGAGLALFITAACIPDDRQAGVAQVRDSAGITIVENPVPEAGRVFAVIDSEPLVEIGVAEGDPAYELFSVSDAGVLSDGSIVLLNSGTRDFRVYDPQGMHLRTFGGAGEGPGEFGYVMEFWVLPGDTIITVDMWNWRVSWLDPEGELIRDVVVDRAGYPAETVHILPNAALLAYLWGPETSHQGVTRRQIAFVLIDPVTEQADTLGWFGSLENFWFPYGGRQRANSRPFAADTRWALGADYVFIGDNASYEIQAYGLDARLERIIRLEALPVPVTADDRRTLEEQVMEWVAERPADVQAYYRRSFAEAPWPDHKPAFSQLLVDTGGNLWVGHFRSRAFGLPSEYDVFDRDGIWRGFASLPEGVEPLEIGQDYLIGKRRDEVDVEYVGMYRLTRTR